jgi:hypothetical protein
MALTFTPVSRKRAGVQDGGQQIFETVTKVTWDNSTYAAGGVALTAANLGLSVLSLVKSVNPAVAEGAAGTMLAGAWDLANGKVKLYKGNGTSPLQEAAAADANGLTQIIVAEGY